MVLEFVDDDDESRVRGYVFLIIYGVGFVLLYLLIIVF